MLCENEDKQDVISLLIIEDDIDDFYIVKELLHKDPLARYDVLHTAQLGSAIKILGKRQIDLILLDLNIEDSEGLETLQRLSQQENEVPIVVLTGLNEEEIGKKAIQAGATDYLPKSHVSPYMLSRTIDYGIERHRLTSELKKRANEDSLTGLPNRSALYLHLASLTEQIERNGSTLAIAMVDLDGFKAVNDEHGHQCGDRLLRQVAQRLTKNLRKSDYVSRLAGDEFIVLIGNYKSDEELMNVLDKIRSQIEKPFNIELKESVVRVAVSISIGVVEWQAGYSVEQIISLADSQMYESKRLGKNRITRLEL